MTGVVSWFNDPAGWGFIRRQEGGKDAFVHHSEIQGQRGRRTLHEGDTVEFDVRQTEKGPVAYNVSVIEPGGAADAQERT